MSEQNHSGNYNHIRCPVCSRPWSAWHDPVTGRGEGPHPDHVLIRGRTEPLACAIHRPVAAPGWVEVALANHERAATASNLPATISDSEVARREVIGGIPTREWPEASGGIPPGEFLAAVMARAHEKNGAKS